MIGNGMDLGLGGKVALVTGGDRGANAAVAARHQRDLPAQGQVHPVSAHVVSSFAPHWPQKTKFDGMHFAPHDGHVWRYGPHRNSLLPPAAAVSRRPR